MKMRHPQSTIRRRAYNILLLASLLLLARQSSAGSFDGLRLAIHLVPSTGEPCSEIDWSTFSCDEINVVGDNSVAQRAYFLFTGTDSLVAADFGLYYGDFAGWSPEDIGDWSFCKQTSFQRLSLFWPYGFEGNEAFARWWDGPLAAASDSIVVLGAIDFHPGVKGGLCAFAVPSIGYAIAINVNGVSQDIHYRELEKFGRVSLDGSADNPTNNPCADVDVPTSNATWTQVKSLFR
jgi:hypothetical protein